MRTRVVGAVLAVALVAAACGGGSSASEKILDLRGKATKGSYPTVTVTAKDNEFTPRAIRIAPGVTVKWTNEGRNLHDLRPADPDQDFGGPFGVEPSDFGPGKTYEFRFDKPGVYRYYCSLHGTPTRGMTGLVVVGDVDVKSGISPSGAVGFGGTLRVPKDYPTIQAAVDAAKPGALVLVSPGIYHEAVQVTTKNLVIRGLDRNKVVLDGRFELENGVKVVGANGVAVENMTARNYTANGFFWTGVTGYRGSYLTSYRTGDYGIYAFDSRRGQFDHDYASGSPDAGFYIGQCDPCDAVIDHVVGEWNGLGYSGTNSGGNLLIVRSVFRNNRAGVVPNSGNGEKDPPEKQTTVVGNLVLDNNNDKTPAIDIAITGQGFGVLIAGGQDNVVERNLVIGHDYGLAAGPNPDAGEWPVKGNSFRDNVVRDSTVSDLALIAAPDGNNCFAGNVFTTSEPAHLEQLAPCEGSSVGSWKDHPVDIGAILAAKHAPSADYQTASPVPPPQANMPNPKNPFARPATDVPEHVDLSRIKVPKAPAGR